MRLIKITLLFLFTLNASDGYSQEEMKIAPEQIEETQIFVNNVLSRKRFFNPKQEHLFAKDLLNRDLIKIYAVEAAFNLYPEIKNHKYRFAAAEDKSGKLWFAYVSIEGALDGLITLIFVKKDGRLLYYTNHM